MIENYQSVNIVDTGTAIPITPTTPTTATTTPNYSLSPTNPTTTPTTANFCNSYYLQLKSDLKLLSLVC